MMTTPLVVHLPEGLGIVGEPPVLRSHWRIEAYSPRQCDPFPRAELMEAMTRITILRQEQRCVGGLVIRQ